MFAVHDTTLPFTFELPETVPFAFNLTVLAEHLAPLVDQRKRRGKRYPLVPLLLTAVLAKLAGYPRLAPSPPAQVWRPRCSPAWRYG